jgi:hypothetical protein
MHNLFYEQATARYYIEVFPRPCVFTALGIRVVEDNFAVLK